MLPSVQASPTSENVQDVWKFALTDEMVEHPLDFTIPEEDKKDEKKD